MSFSRYNLYFPEHRSFWWRKKHFLKKARGHEVHLFMVFDQLACRAGADDLPAQKWANTFFALIMMKMMIIINNSTINLTAIITIFFSSSDITFIWWPGQKYVWLPLNPLNPDTTDGQKRKNSYRANLQILRATSRLWRVGDQNETCPPPSLLQMPCSWLAGLVISCRGYLMPSYDQLHVEPKARFFLKEQKYIQDKLTRWTDLLVYLMDL